MSKAVRQEKEGMEGAARGVEQLHWDVPRAASICTVQMDFCVPEQLKFHAGITHTHGVDSHLQPLLGNCREILALSYCSKGIYCGRSAKKRTEKFHRSTYICFSWKQTKLQYAEKP